MAQPFAVVVLQLANAAILTAHMSRYAARKRLWLYIYMKKGYD